MSHWIRDVTMVSDGMLSLGMEIPARMADWTDWLAGRVTVVLSVNFPRPGLVIVKTGFILVCLI